MRTTLFRRRTPNASAPASFYVEWGPLLMLTLVGVGLLCRGLGVPGLMDPDEGRYAEIAREMLVGKNWFIPHLNLLPYLEKPPLVYWLTALSMAGFGLTEGAARLIPALSGLAGILWAYFFGRALWGPVPAWRGALILATCGGYVILGRILTLDMTLALFLNLAIGLGYLALSRGQRGLWPWAYLALGLAVLTKGPVALVLAGLIWGIWAWLRKHPFGLSFYQVLGLVILAGVTLPWFLYVSRRYPEFLGFFLWDQHVGRFLTASIHHHQPWYFFGPVLLGLMLPWSGLLPWMLIRLKPAARPDHLFLAVWAGTVILFFSLSRGKLVPYILPALFPLALLVGDSLPQPQDQGEDRRYCRGFWYSLALWGGWWWLLLLLFLRPPATLQPLVEKAVTLSTEIFWGLLVLALFPTLALTFKRPVVLFAGALLFCTLLPSGIEKISAQRSPRELAAKLTAHWQPEAALVGVRLYSQGLSFYSRQVFHLLACKSELDFGRRLAPSSGLFFAEPQEMAAFAASRGLVFFFVKEKAMSSLYQWLPGDFQAVGRYKDCLLLCYRGK